VPGSQVGVRDPPPSSPQAASKEVSANSEHSDAREDFMQTFGGDPKRE
jgi:hypothetical protein